MTIEKAISRIASMDWQECQPVWTIKHGRNTRPTTPHDFQEKHAPSRPTAKAKAKAKANAKPHHPQPPRRRVLDARLWNTLSPHHQEAAQQIEQACHILSHGLGFRISSPHQLGGGGHKDMSEYQTTLSTYYMKWARLCQDKGVSHAACLDILTFGKSCLRVDQDRRVRKGWARNNLADGLALYCHIRGWPEN